MRNPFETGKLLTGAFCCALAVIFFAGSRPAAAYEDILTTEEMQGTLEKTRLSEVFEQYLATVQIFDPERATRLGIHSADSYLTQRTPERVAKQLEALRNLRVKLLQVNKSAMYPEFRLDHKVLDHILEVDIYELENLGLLARRPQYYLEPAFLIFQMMSKDYEDYNLRAANALARLKQVPVILEQAERNLARPPELWTRQAMKQSLDCINYISDFVAIFRAYSKYDPLLKTQVDDAIEQAKAAFARYAAFLEKDILPVSDGDLSVGSAFYRFYLERLHSLDIAPGASYSHARKAFKTSLKELEKEAVTVDALLAREKGWKGVLEKLPKEHPAEGEVLKAFQDEMDRAYQHFDEHKVVEFPRQRLLIKRMPNFMASVLPYVYYAPAFALDDTRVSELFMLLPPDTASQANREKTLASGYNYAQVELLTAYSIMPGIHLRNFEASSNRSRIRRVSRQPVVANGWACYAELLAEEMGFYSSYWSRFLRCYTRFLRSARAYADTALHTRKWKPEEAAQFFQEKLFMNRTQAYDEVLKLSLAPTDGFSFVYGLDRILEMRRYYERTEAKYFDLRKFHTMFLKMGEIPIEDIAEEVKRQKREDKNIF
ncbi:MAG: hypothetical protein A2234_10070 [Elusimicrobia bacterium RIFOXYA2_FULL_58_8]|nr:MAG: hypothetical protein A2285_04910 [Elusimicrobia bacterium RIFOXYA12_FULL_57_11]OGS14308.1 MAG: hypothetical protein A2234_10070 [Elusimicrobia bacterium RIFOXYA2_FULL_58_8]